MRIFTIQSASVSELDSLDSASSITLPEHGYLWIACSRDEFGSQQKEVQSMLHERCGIQIVDLHVSDLLNPYIPSHYDYTYQYDILVFRRLTSASGSSETIPRENRMASAKHRGGPPIVKRIDTSPVGFAVFGQILLSVHPTDCPIRETFASRLLSAGTIEAHLAGARPPSSPADLMLRIINLMVDGFLELRRDLSRQLDRWQSELLDPKSRFDNWAAMLDARLTLHYLDEICEDQHAAIQDWIEAVKTWPEAATPQLHRERDLLKVRSRDVLEHIERVAHHVRRLEHSTETAVQMHFNAQGHRTNSIMRTLTTLTAIFLPLNLIAGIFGMNFDSLPLIHRHEGFWWATGAMLAIALVLSVFFWRKSYLSRSNR